MDPLSAFGLAVNILTVIDFSYKIFSSASEIAKSGATQENHDLKIIIGDLQKVSKGLKKPALGTSEHDIALNTLAQRCQIVSKELEDNLAKLQVENGTSRIKSLGEAIRSVYKKQSISDRVKTLEQYRSQILLHLVAILGDRQVTMHLQIEDMQSELKLGSSEMAEKLNELKQELQATQRLISQPLAPDQPERADSIQRLEQALNQVLEQSAPPTPEVRVLNQLYRDTMYFREDQIVKSSDKTFTWLLDNSDSETELDGVSDDSDSKSESDQASANSVFDLNDFQDEIDQRQRWFRLETARQQRSEATTALLTWLSSENGLFHISGRAGSGKSTLMKMIYNHPRTRRELDFWSGDKQLILSHHFFYSVGSPQARSLEGLYRSILFETLLQQPDLISKVFPEAYSAFRKNTTMSTIDDLFFRFERLQGAMDRLIECSSGPRYRLCLFIDGLDEFGEGKVKFDDYQLLALKLMSWARMPNVKILASSRPEALFLTVFKDQRRIQLHKLNELDILEYGLQRLESFEIDEKFLPPQDCYRTLLEDLAERSNGIFLWASLVVGQLLHKLSAGERIATVRMQFDTIPQGMTKLYHQILKSIEPSDFEKALRMFWLAICSDAYSPVGGLSLFAISWADDMFDDDQFPSSYDMATHTPKEKEDREKLAKKQLNYTKGLLETSSKSDRGASKGTVVFAHRTAYDFIRNSDELRSYTSRYAGVTINLLQIRLALAEIWFDEILSTANGRLNDVLAGFRTVNLWDILVEDNQGQAHYWLDAFERIIKYRLGNGSAKFSTYSTNLRGLCSLTNGQLSWPHWMLCVLGNDDFVISRLERMPSLSLHHEELSPLLSCALENNFRPSSRRTRLIQFLLQHGASPNERVIAKYQESLICASVWQFFCVATADCLIRETRIREEQMYMLAIFEQFLRTKLVDPDILVLLAVRKISEGRWAGSAVDDATHVIAFLDLIRQRLPDEFDHWTTLFRAVTQCSKSWLMSLINRGPKPSNRRFSGKYLPFTLDMELPEPYRTSGKDYSFKVQAIVVGGTMLPADNLHVKLW